MADGNEEKKDVPEGKVLVDQTLLQSILEKQADLERQVAESDAKSAGLQEMFEKSQDAETTGDEKKKLRTRKSFEPAFRTVRLRKYPMAGDVEKLGWVVGWTNRGAYQKVDRSGVAPVLVDYIDILFLGHERNAEGKLQAESVPLLDLLNKGEQIYCKIIDTKREPRIEPTGEEINVTVWDPQHGLVSTGDIIDGYVAFTDLTYTVAVPGIKDPVVIDGQFVN